MTKRTVHLIASLALVVPLLAITGGAAEAAAATYDFEACDQGWTQESQTASTQPVPTSEWHRGPSGNASANAFHSGTPYGGDANELLISPAHAWKGGKVTVKFDIRYQFEPEETSLGADNVSIEWSRNGADWAVVEVYKPLSDAFPAYTTKEVSFTVPKGKLYVGFRLVSDQLLEGYGASVDNVVVPAAMPKSAAC